MGELRDGMIQDMRAEQIVHRNADRERFRVRFLGLGPPRMGGTAASATYVV